MMRRIKNGEPVFHTHECSDDYKSDVDMKSKEQFAFKVVDEYEKPAIWFNLRDKEVKIYPMPLFESLWECYNKRRISKEIEARFQIFGDKVCGYYYDDSCGSYSTEYERDTYINSAIQALTRLSNYVIEGNDSPYHSFTRETAEYMLADLKCLAIPKNYSQVFCDEVAIEDFSFQFVEPYSCDTAYEIKIGSRTYFSVLSDWSTNFNLIRNEIEAFVYVPWNDDIDIHLYCEDSPTTLRFNMKNLYWDKNALRVIVMPDGFSHRPPIFAWCKPQQLVRSLYLGLLELFATDTDWFDDGMDGDWDNFRLKAYNQLQSNVIEDFIKGVKIEDNVSSRNRVISSVDEMLEDYNVLKCSLCQISL